MHKLAISSAQPPREGPAAVDKAQMTGKTAALASAVAEAAGYPDLAAPIALVAEVGEKYGPDVGKQLFGEIKKPGFKSPPTLRTWMVVTEETFIVYYPCKSEQEAREFFRHLQEKRWPLSKILFDDTGREILSGGWNPVFANQRIRRKHGGSFSLCGRISTRDGHISPVLPGAIIVLYNPRWSCTLRITSKGHVGIVRQTQPKTNQGKPPAPAPEHLFVVDVGQGEIALYSALRRRFLTAVDDRLETSDKVCDGCNPILGMNERFAVVEAGEGSIALHSRASKRFIKVHDDGVLMSPKRDPDILLDFWDMERFRPVVMVAAPVAGYI